MRVPMVGEHHTATVPSACFGQAFAANRKATQSAPGSVSAPPPMTSMEAVRWASSLDNAAAVDIPSTAKIT